MLSKSLSTSEKFAALEAEAGALAEFCQALYPLIISHSDDFGRLQGDAFTIKHQCYPASPRTLEEFKGGLQHLHNVELIIWYQVNQKQYIQIPRFDDHQVGLHKRTRSAFPKYSDLRKGQLNDVPGISGNFPANRREENLTKENLRELKRSTDDLATKEPSPAHEFLVWFQVEYKKQRNGATYLVSWKKHTAIVKHLLTAFNLERLKDLATVMLTSNEEWIESTDRGIESFTAKVNWLEDRMAAAETQGLI